MCYQSRTGQTTGKEDRVWAQGCHRGPLPRLIHQRAHQLPQEELCLSRTFFFFFSLSLHICFSLVTPTQSSWASPNICTVSMYRQCILCEFVHHRKENSFVFCWEHSENTFDQIKFSYKITHTNEHFSVSFCFMGSVLLFMRCSLIGQKHAQWRLYLCMCLSPVMDWWPVKNVFHHD